MTVLTLKLITKDAFALLIHLDMLTFLTVVKVKNDYVCLTVVNTKKIDGTVLRPLGNQRN